MTSNYFISLFSLGGALLVLWCSLTGWGYAVFHISGFRNVKDLQVSAAGWIGITCVMAMTQVAHLFLPITWQLSAFILIPGLILWGAHYWGNSANPASRNGKMLFWIIQHPVITLLLALASIALLTKAMQTPGNFDSGLYHFASIRWANEYAVVPGLGNLHGRLAFNQSIFDLYALLNFFPLWNKGYALGYLLMMLLCSATVFESRLERNSGGWWALMICTIAIASTISSLPSPTPDPIIALLQISIFVTLLGVLLNPNQNTLSTTTYLSTLVCLCALICTVKLSSIVFALLCLLIAMRYIYQAKILPKHLTLYCAAIGSILVASHLLHGIMTSGVAFYPSSLGAGLQLDWLIPPEKIQNELNWVYSWARNPHQDPALVLGNWRWLKSWVIYLLPIAAWFYFGLSALLLVLHSVSKDKQDQSLIRQLQLLYVPLVLSILFWFFTAPDWRFLGAIPQIFLAVSGWIFLCSKTALPTGIQAQLSRPIFWLAPSALLACFKLFPLTLDGWQVIPQAVLEQKITHSGLSVWVPVNGQTQCWDGPLPCTPYFNENLSARDLATPAQSTSSPPTLQNGFIDSPTSK
ncbi:hypothetical protein ICN41_08960 [Polynucleobacter sp. 15G-AUS-farblos]|uniref:LIC_10190 family membrane protein n=1 Tax=Polynucleobacter sp. 15G-AUS-farblos TaxID=2689094 RepID=UPI001C0C7B30|nr:hypothetical protein [Polynucleobacter sp. 15G-AUS-farblos]MBU3584113.1 hypothetical protein [Polynucleobacter sp. 15G-AUS-farblos]